MRRVKFRALIVGAVCAILVGCGPLGLGRCDDPRGRPGAGRLHLNRPVYVDRGAERHQPGVHRPEGRADPDPPERADARDAVPEPDQERLERAASRACCRWRSTPTTQATAASSCAHRPRRRQPADRLPRVPDHRNIANPFTRTRAADDPPALRQPQRRHDRVRQGREPLLRPRRRRQRGRSQPQRPEADRVPIQDLRHQRQRRNAEGLDLRLRPAQPLAVLVRPRDRRRCGSATSARTATRRSTTSAPGTSPGTNFGWSYYEGDHVYKVQPIDRTRLVFPVAEYSHNPGGNCAVTGGYVYRGTRHPVPLRLVRVR